MLETLIDQSIERLGEYCAKEENLEALHDRIVIPFLRHITLRFSWIAMSVQFVVGMMFVQTVLLIILLLRRTAI